MAKVKASCKENTPKKRTKSNLLITKMGYKCDNSKIKKTQVKKKIQTAVCKTASPKKKLLTISGKKISGSKSKLVVKKEKNTPTQRQNLEGDHLKQDLIPNKRKAKVVKVPKEKKKQKIETIPKGAPLKAKIVLKKKENSKENVVKKGNTLKKNKSPKETVKKDNAPRKKDSSQKIVISKGNTVKKKKNSKEEVVQKGNNGKVKSALSSAKPHPQSQKSSKVVKLVRRAMVKPAGKGKNVKTKPGTGSVQPQSVTSSKLTRMKSVAATVKSAVKGKLKKNQLISSNRAKKPKKCDTTPPEVANDCNTPPEVANNCNTTPPEVANDCNTTPPEIANGYNEEEQIFIKAMNELSNLVDASEAIPDENSPALDEEISEEKSSAPNGATIEENCSAPNKEIIEENCPSSSEDLDLDEEIWLFQKARDEIISKPLDEENDPQSEGEITSEPLDEENDPQSEGEITSEPLDEENDPQSEDEITSEPLDEENDPQSEDSSTESAPSDNQNKSPETQKNVLEKSTSKTIEDSSIEIAPSDTQNKSPETPKNILEKSPSKNIEDSSTESAPSDTQIKSPETPKNILEKSPSKTIEDSSTESAPSDNQNKSPETPKNVLEKSHLKTIEDVSTKSSASEMFSVKSTEVQNSLTEGQPSQSIKEDLYLSSSTSRWSSVDSLSSDSAFGLHDLSQKRKLHKRSKRNSSPTTKNRGLMKNSPTPGQDSAPLKKSPSKSLSSVDDDCFSSTPIKKRKVITEELKPQIPECLSKSCFVKLEELGKSKLNPHGSWSSTKSTDSDDNHTPVKATSQVTTPVSLSKPNQKMDQPRVVVYRVDQEKPRLDRSALLKQNTILRKNNTQKAAIEPPPKPVSDVRLNGMESGASISLTKLNKTINQVNTNVVNTQVKPKLNKSVLLKQNKIFIKNNAPKAVIEPPPKTVSDVQLNCMESRAVNIDNSVEKTSHKVIQRLDKSIVITRKGQPAAPNNVVKIPQKNNQNHIPSGLPKKINVVEKCTTDNNQMESNLVNGISGQKSSSVVSLKSNSLGKAGSSISQPQNKTPRKRIFLEDDDLVPLKKTPTFKKKSISMVKTVLNESVCVNKTVSVSKTVNMNKTTSFDSSLGTSVPPNKSDDHVFTVPQPVHDRKSVGSVHQDKEDFFWGNNRNSLSHSASIDNDDTQSVLSIIVNEDLLSEVEKESSVEQSTSVPFGRRSLGPYSPLKNAQKSTVQPKICEPVSSDQSNARFNNQTSISLNERLNFGRPIQPVVQYNPKNSHKRNYRFVSENDVESEEDDDEMEMKITHTRSPVKDQEDRINHSDVNRPATSNATKRFCERIASTTSSWDNQEKFSFSDSILDGYCLTFWRTSLDQKIHQCGLKHEMLPSLANKDKNEVLGAIERTIEENFCNPPITVLKAFVEFCGLEDKKTTITRIGKFLKKNLKLDENCLQRTRNLWGVFIDQCIATTTSVAKSKKHWPPIDISGTIHQYLKDIFDDLREDSRVLWIVLERLALAWSYKTLKLLNCVEFLFASNYPLNQYPPSFKLAVTKQVIKARSEGLSYNTVQKFAFKVCKKFYNDNRSIKEMYSYDAKTVEQFSRLTEEVKLGQEWQRRIERACNLGGSCASGLAREKNQGFKSLDSQSDNNYSHPTQPSKDNFFNPTRRPASDLDLKKVLLQSRFNPTEVIRYLEKNNLLSSHIFETFAAFREGQDCYNKILEDSSDALRETLNDVTLSFMSLSYQRGDIQRCRFYYLLMINWTPTKLRDFFGEPKSPAAIVFLFIKIHLMHHESIDFRTAVHLCTQFNLHCLDYSKWKVNGTEKDKDLQESMFSDFKTALSQNILSENLCKGFSIVIEMQKSLQQPIDVSSLLTGFIDKLMNDPQKRSKAVLLVATVVRLSLLNTLVIDNCNHYRFFIIELLKKIKTEVHKDEKAETWRAVSHILLKAKNRLVCYPRDLFLKSSAPSSLLQVVTSLAPEEMWLVVSTKLKLFSYQESLRVNFVISNDSPPFTDIDCSVYSAKERFKRVLFDIVPEAGILREDHQTIIVDRITLEAYRERNGLK